MQTLGESPILTSLEPFEKVNVTSWRKRQYCYGVCRPHISKLACMVSFLFLSFDEIRAGFQAPHSSYTLVNKFKFTNFSICGSDASSILKLITLPLPETRIRAIGCFLLPNSDFLIHTNQSSSNNFLIGCLNEHEDGRKRAVWARSGSD
jgi:hypothetical protein